jgi:glycosyltransferase involved in cell wall biosynthesis
MATGGFGIDGADLSIVIPTYNCAAYLEVALGSLRGQGIDAAQVLVVDDCSTEDDPEAVVAEHGWPGVGFHRQPRNLGLLGNFRSCVQLAERPWVHLLHGDDFVLPGGYFALDAVLRAHPDARFLLGRSVLVGEDGQWDGVTRLIADAPSGALPYDPMRWRLNPVQFAGVVFRRDAYEQVGGFHDAYVHCADWSLWWRLARAVPTAYTNTAVGAYRRFGANHTAGLIRSAANLREGLDLLAEIAAAEPDLGPELYGPLLALAKDQAQRRAAGDPEAFRAHVRAIAAFPRGVPRVRTIARIGVSHLKARAEGRQGVEEER